VGNVSVQCGAGSKAIPVKVAFPLHVGDRVLVGVGARAKIIFADRPPKLLGPGQRYVVTRTPPVIRASSAEGGVLARAWKAIVTRLKSAFVGERAAPPATARGADDEALPHLVYPRNTAILEAEPQFAWTEVEGAQRYVVIIAFYSTYEKTCQIPSATTSAAYPQDGVPLQPGRKYFWCVENQDDPDSLSEGVWFIVLHGQTRNEYLAAAHAVEELYADDAQQRNEVLGYLAADYRLFALAAEYLNAALELGAEGAAIRMALARIYERLDMPDAAKRTLEQLETLTDEERAAWQGTMPPPQNQAP
jgi:hypothetical protein